MRGWWDLWGHTCAVFVCSVGAWKNLGKNHAPSALYLYLQYLYCICGDIGVGYLRGVWELGQLSPLLLLPKYPSSPPPPLSPLHYQTIC